MANFDFSGTTPFEAIHVGSYIKDELEARNMQQKELAKLTGIHTSVLNDIIKGKRDLTAEHSVLIGKALGIDEAFFYDLQKQYDLDRARLSERVAQQAAAIAIWNILKDFISEKFFKKVGVITSDIKIDVENIFKVFGVNNLDDFLVLKEQEARLVYYKKSAMLATNEKDLFSWKYYCMYLAKQRMLEKAFDKSNITTVCNELNTIFAENQDVIERTKETCTNYGIKFLIVKKEGQVPIDGMSFWQGDNPTIVLTLRRATIDNFAFAIMHELGHLQLHLDEGEKLFINVQEEGLCNKYEYEADDFAKNHLIPAEKWRLFSQTTKNISPYQIKPYIMRFAEENGINPQIVSGRYMHEAHFYKMSSTFTKSIN